MPREEDLSRPATSGEVMSLRRDIAELRTDILGKPGHRVGLATRLDRVERKVKTATRLVWILVTAAVTFGFGLLKGWFTGSLPPPRINP